jgi:hypothetical protein
MKIKLNCEKNCAKVASFIPKHMQAKLKKISWLAHNTFYCNKLMQQFQKIFRAFNNHDLK